MKSRISATPKSSKTRRTPGGFAGFWIFGLLFLIVRPLGAIDIKDSREVSTHKPVNITASELTFDRHKGLTSFKGKVKAAHDKVILTADQVQALAENKEASAQGNVKVVDPAMGATMTCGNLEYQDLMNIMTAHEHPLLVCLDESGLPITVLGRQMEMDSEKKTVVINQNVQVLHDNGLAEAQKATFFSKDDKFILEDEPQVTLPNGKLSGRRIVSNMGNDRRIIIDGMADAVFYPDGSTSTGKRGPRKGSSDPTSPSGPKGPMVPKDSATPGASGGNSH